MNTNVELSRPLTPLQSVLDEEVQRALELAASIPTPAAPLSRGASPLIFGPQDSDGEPEIVYTDTRSQKAEVQHALDLAAVFPESLRLGRLFRHFEAWHHITTTAAYDNVRIDDFHENRKEVRLKQRLLRWRARWDSTLSYSSAHARRVVFLTWKASHFQSKSAAPAPQPTSMPSPHLSAAWDRVRKAASSVKEDKDRREEEATLRAVAFLDELPRRWLARHAVQFFDAWKHRAFVFKLREGIRAHIQRRLRYLRARHTFSLWTGAL